jgi:lipoate-protein ligase A
LPQSKNESFAKVCNAVVLSLKRLGIDGIHKPVNDILVNGKKISGGAQARTRNAVLQHGSIILDADHDATASSLIETKQRTYNGLTSMKECLGHVPKRDDIADALISGFEEMFGPIAKGELNEKEKADIERSAGLLLVQIVHIQ